MSKTLLSFRAKRRIRTFLPKQLCCDNARSALQKRPRSGRSDFPSPRTAGDRRCEEATGIAPRAMCRASARQAPYRYAVIMRAAHCKEPAGGIPGATVRSTALSDRVKTTVQRAFRLSKPHTAGEKMRLHVRTDSSPAALNDKGFIEKFSFCSRLKESQSRRW